jgi:HAD superfamily hydrolase (TIGR01490 family)
MAADGEGGRAAAFFDLDKTLMAGSSGMVFARVANQRGFVPRRQLAKWGWDHLRYRLRGSSDEQTNAVLDVAKKVFAEMPERDVERMAPAVLAGILPRIYPQMLDEVHRHQDDGRATFIVSAAGNDLVKALAAVLGMEGGIGTAWAVGTDGKFTGEMDGPFVYGEGKVEAMQRFAEKHDIDMDASYAYSDSASDLPMLRSVGNAVVVNPDAELLEIARQEGWRVMRFEKLGRKLAIAGATVLAAAAGGLGALASKRRHGGSWAAFRAPCAARQHRGKFSLQTRMLLWLCGTLVLFKRSAGGRRPRAGAG